jgi:hypothetical protein
MCRAARGAVWRLIGCGHRLFLVYIRNPIDRQLHRQCIGPVMAVLFGALPWQEN